MASEPGRDKTAVPANRRRPLQTRHQASSAQPHLGRPRSSDEIGRPQDRAEALWSPVPVESLSAAELLPWEPVSPPPSERSSERTLGPRLEPSKPGHLFEREREQGEGQRERKEEEQTPHGGQSLTRGSISRAQDHDLS